MFSSYIFLFSTTSYTFILYVLLLSLPLFYYFLHLHSICSPLFSSSFLLLPTPSFHMFCSCLFLFSTTSYTFIPYVLLLTLPLFYYFLHLHSICSPLVPSSFLLLPTPSSCIFSSYLFIFYTTPHMSIPYVFLLSLPILYYFLHLQPICSLISCLIFSPPFNPFSYLCNLFSIPLSVLDIIFFLLIPSRPSILLLILFMANNIGIHCASMNEYKVTTCPMFL